MFENQSTSQKIFTMGTLSGSMLGVLFGSLKLYSLQIIRSLVAFEHDDREILSLGMPYLILLLIVICQLLRKRELSLGVIIGFLIFSVVHILENSLAGIGGFKPNERMKHEFTTAIMLPSLIILIFSLIGVYAYIYDRLLFVIYLLGTTISVSIFHSVFLFVFPSMYLIYSIYKNKINLTKVILGVLISISLLYIADYFHLLAYQSLMHRTAECSVHPRSCSLIYYEMNY